jgi:N-acetylglucosaminyldiphosphoundecaprenol N-acetyl-beta-D-mannosaminyltransferase
MNSVPLKILQSPINPLNLTSAKSEILSFAAKEKKAYIIFRDVHGVIRCQDDPDFLKAHQEAALVCPDGMPLVWIGRRKGYKEMGRVYGPDMMRELMNATRDGSATHFLYGGKEGVAETLKTKLETQYPGVEIVGCECPPFGPLSPEVEKSLQERISTLKPDFFWVGLSTPKQEFFMQKYLHQLDTTVMLGVGAAFDYLSGTVKEPPVWIQRSGFQWLYRIISEPRRLFSRYLKTVPRFMWLYLKEERTRKKTP